MCCDFSKFRFVRNSEEIFFGVETGPNYSRELATFLKYHMPLNFKNVSFYDIINSSTAN